QIYFGAGVRPYGHYYPWGYYFGAYDSSWSNGFSLYGPPVPTYGPIPGTFGGSTARLNDYRNSPGTVPARGWPRYNYNHVMPTYVRFELTLPDPDAVVTLDDLPVQQTGTQRAFRATGLEPGEQHQFRLRVAWFDGGRPVVRDQLIDVRAGSTVRVDLTKPQSP